MESRATWDGGKWYVRAHDTVLVVRPAAEVWVIDLVRHRGVAQHPKPVGVCGIAIWKTGLNARRAARQWFTMQDTIERLGG